ncbi:galactose-3-O-sulfotransferase 2-like [Mercenaria mercenaria]|uniref:galactose-3-O-sulfotransferase 2-like n=1 Tax=Mercenaria mercenaria TaxID=6596 RepID=UPI00234E9E70|nr:galactose-3-O-sulfotransferase 2-like [Mercenaria mercenaria]
MLQRRKFTRKYWKAFMCILTISIIAFIITKEKEQKITDIVSSGIKTTKEVKLTYRHTTLRQNVEDGQVITDMQIVAKHGEKQYTEMFKDVPAEKQTHIEQSNVTTIGHSNIISTTRGPEVRHIAFLKVHKAASSTMQNMFFRFGRKRNLTFVFTRHPNYFSRSAHRHLPLVRPKLRNGYDILCNHGVFNYNIYSSLLPNDTVYIGIVRNPLSVFISAVNYYSQPSQLLSYLAFIRGEKLHKLIHNPDIYDKGFFSYTKNVMARDFGFPESDNSDIITQKLTELDNIFTLVLIVEHFEESLVLMKRYLRWKMQDILFVPNNVYVEHARSVSSSDLTSSDIQKFRVRNKLDYDLYNFFTVKFWKQFKNQPDDIKLEVLHFKKVLENVSAFCNMKKMDDNQGYLTTQRSDWNEEFVTSAEDCEFMKTGELKFIQILRQKQGSEITGPVRNVHQRRNRFGVDGMRNMGFQQRKNFQRQRMMENRQRNNVHSQRLAARDRKPPRRY